MSMLLDRIAGLFLEPPPQEVAAVEERVRWLPPGRPAVSSLVAGTAAPEVDRVSGSGAGASNVRPPRIAVVCSRRDARLAGAAVGLALGHLTHASAVTVAEWSGRLTEKAADRLATPAARRTAGALRDLGLVAGCGGRLARALLAADEAEAAAEARVLAEQSPVPAVVVVAGPRGPAFDGLLAQQDLVVLVVRPGEDPELVSIAVAELSRLGTPTAPVELPSSPGATALARSGTALVAPLRGPLLAALRGER